MRFEYLTQLINPGHNTPWWLNSYASSACALQIDEKNFVFFITGRDKYSRSRIGRAFWNSDDPSRIQNYDREPCLDLGSHNSFSHFGTSYPFILRENTEYILGFTGWTREKFAPFGNYLCIARAKSPLDTFASSHQPILFNRNDEPTTAGSSVIYKEGSNYVLYYTHFKAWDNKPTGEMLPRYDLRKTTSKNIERFCSSNEKILGDTFGEDVLCCRPNVLNKKLYFCARPAIGYYNLFSSDLINRNSIAQNTEKIQLYSNQKWDRQEQCYPFIFESGKNTYMLYSGNSYGRGGLGLACARK